MKYFLSLLAVAFFLMGSFINAEASIPRFTPDSYPSIYVEIEMDEDPLPVSEDEMVHFTEMASAKELCNAIKMELVRLTEEAEENTYPKIFIPYGWLKESKWSQVIEEVEKQKELVIYMVESEDKKAIEGFLFELPESF